MASSKILIIDDDQDITDTFQDILETKGFSVHSCNNGREGLKYAKSNFVNVAIVDIRLPDMSGDSLLSELKEISASTETIVLTGFGSLDTAVEAITQQAFAYLLKPVDPEILIRTIKNCIEKQELLLLLKESENRFRMQFKHFPIPAYIWQKKENNFVLIDFNLYAEKITEGKISKFKHVKAQDLFHNKPEILNDMKLCFENKMAIQQEMFYEYQTTGGKKFLNVSYSFVPPDLIVVYTEDITEKKRIEQVRIELENKRTRFISMTSHELRTPLTAIQGFLEILEDRLDELDQERRDQCLKIIKRNLFRIERLVDGVSDLVKIEQGFFDLELREIDFIDFLEQVMQTYKPFLGDQLEVIHRQGNISALIESDVDRLNQVIDNIINNAIKHTSKESRKISVNSDILKDVVKIFISDNGAGISPEHQEQLFKPFTSFSTKYSTGGSGIGLYLSWKIVEEHGGTLSVKSEGLDCGSTLIIELPRK